MNIDTDLLSSPFFIMKKLQRDAFRRSSALLRGRVLDAGCGTRPFRRYLDCSEYVGIDESGSVSPELCASASSIPFKDGYFDSVICTEVIEHVARPPEVLREVGRVLKPGGHLYLSAPQSWGIHYEPHDYWRFTRYGIELLLADEGLRIVSVERIGGIFTLVGQHAVDVLSRLLKRAFSFLGPRRSERTAALLCLPLSVFFYCLGSIGDRIDTGHALGWAVVAVK